MRKHLLLMTAAAAELLLLRGTSRAEDAPVDCTHAETQYDLNVCSQQGFDRADTELNTDYQKLIKRLQGGEGKSLERFKATQRAWIKFRDAECDFQGSFSEGGSIQPMLINGCLKALTQRRVKDMEYYLNCEEGDMSCPVAGGQ